LTAIILGYRIVYTQEKGERLKIITFASLKGGVGKTTCTIFLSQALQQLGARVLTIDLDGNPNLTDYFLRSQTVDELESNNIAHFIVGAKGSEAIYKTDFGIDFIPSTMTLPDSLELSMRRDAGILLRFPSNLKKLDYDFIIIDSTPYKCHELLCSIYAAHLVVVPVFLTRWTVQGYQQVYGLVQKAAETTGRAADLRVLASIVGEKEAIELSEMKPWTPLKSAILRNPAVRNACNRGYSLKQESKSWEHFMNLAREVMK
jgi:chromosome partitioning protein